MSPSVRIRQFCFAGLILTAASIAACGGSSTTVVSPGTAGERCAVAVTTTSTTVSAGGGSGSISVQTSRECQWSATADATWLNISSSNSGQGPQTLTFTAAANPFPASRRGGIAVNGQRVEITQDAAACVVSLSTNAVAIGPSGGTSRVAVTAADPCAWTVASRASWVTVSSGSSGSGNGEVVLAVDPNTGAARTGSVEIAGQEVTVSQPAAPAPGCTYSLAPAEATVGAGGGDLTVAISTNASCAWSAISSSPWITFAGSSSGTGSSTVTLRVAANSGAFRSGEVNIGGETFAVVQSAAPIACTYAVSPAQRTVPSAGGTTTATVTTSSGCSWSTTGAPSWIAVTNGSGAGNGTVTFTVQANTGSARTAPLTIAGQPFTIDQTGASGSCSYAINPASFSAPPAGGSVTVNVTTTSGCVWSTTGLPTWITVNGSSGGTGSGSVSLSVQANTGAARSATVIVAGRSFAITQSAASTCTYTVNPTSYSVGALGGSRDVTVTTTAGCSWTTTGLPSWITITNGSGHGSGSDTFTLRVEANLLADRSATLTIAGKSFLVSQAGIL